MTLALSLSAAALSLLASACVYLLARRILLLSCEIHETRLRLADLTDRVDLIDDVLTEEEEAAREEAEEQAEAHAAAVQSIQTLIDNANRIEFVRRNGPWFFGGREGKA